MPVKYMGSNVHSLILKTGVIILNKLMNHELNLRSISRASRLGITLSETSRKYSKMDNLN